MSLRFVVKNCTDVYGAFVQSPCDIVTATLKILNNLSGLHEL